jgi:hypothetical protein
MDGVMSEALAIDPAFWGQEEVASERAAPQGGAAPMHRQVPLNPTHIHSNTISASCAGLATTLDIHPAADFPPTIFCNMVKDKDQQQKYDADVRILRNRGTPVEVIEVSYGTRKTFPIKKEATCVDEFVRLCRGGWMRRSCSLEGRGWQPWGQHRRAAACRSSVSAAKPQALLLVAGVGAQRLPHLLQRPQPLLHLPRQAGS